MKSVVVFGAPPTPAEAAGPNVVEVDGVPLRFGVIETGDAPPPPRSDRDVLVRVDAFSCNYRDRAYMLMARRAGPGRCMSIGSEFAGTVLAAGDAVTGLRPGDRVIGQNEYTGSGTTRGGADDGVPTNRASREYHTLHEDKLIRIPDGMPADDAAAFGIAAQTVYSMVRKLDPRPGDRVLVTSATSNTSLMALGALRLRPGVEVYAATTTRGADDRLRDVGAGHVLHVGGGATLAEAAADAGGFDHVLDPYFDLHVERAVDVLRPGGRYVTCGSTLQTGEAVAAAGRRIHAERLLTRAMTRNLTLIGNCIGLRDDLERALRDYAEGRLPVVVDSVFEGGEAGPFVDRTYNAPDRFGKVVFRL